MKRGCQRGPRRIFFFVGKPLGTLNWGERRRKESVDVSSSQILQWIESISFFLSLFVRCGSLWKFCLSYDHDRRSKNMASVGLGCCCVPKVRNQSFRGKGFDVLCNSFCPKNTMEKFSEAFHLQTGPDAHRLEFLEEKLRGVGHAEDFHPTCSSAVLAPMLSRLRENKR